MTDRNEYMRQYMAKRRAVERAKRPPSPESAGIARLEAQLASARGTIATQAAEIARLREAATAKPAKAEPAPTWDELLMEQRENSMLQKRVHDLERALAAKPKAEKAPLPPDEVYERRIKALTTQIRNLKAERDATNQLTVEAIALAGGMPRETRTAIDKVLHPDSRPTSGDRAEACKGWNAWKNSNDKARRQRA